MRIQSVNPATGEENGEFESYGKDRIDRILKSASSAFDLWKRLGVEERSGYLKGLAKALRDKKHDYARTITMEMGKPIKESVAEVEKCAWTAEVYADNSKKWLEEENVAADGKRHTVVYEPLGVILSIMPWNFPFWQALRFAIPALVVGNVSVLRHSNTVPMSALAIESAFNAAGFPENVFSTVLTDHDAVGYMIRNRRVNGVSLTGSLSAGSWVGQLAGKKVKKFVLELGGSDPFIVLEDADIDFAAKNAVLSRMINSGQSCIAAKRFIVIRKIADRFTDTMVELTRELKVGDPLDEDTQVGPLANMQQLALLEAQVNDAVEKGAGVLVGGKRIPGRGAFFEPTVINRVKGNMDVLKEEVFGPVAPIIVARDEREAIRAANRSELGLAASIWSSNEERAMALARELEVGVVFINGIVKSDPRMPFGGIKKSGVGRELSHYGLKEFTNIKSINLYGQSASGSAHGVE